MTSATHPAAVPATTSFAALRKAAASCQACPLYARATQTVFGEGPRHASIVLMGEQPGDKEDMEGRPFVGPAGQLLDRALAEAGIDRDDCYVTNAVKHFKWIERGKRRLHAKPNRSEIGACRPWWQAEVRLIKPRFLICLGGTAAQAVFGRQVKVTHERGRWQETEWCARTQCTVHPSALLRIQDHAGREAAYMALVADLALTKRRP